MDTRRILTFLLIFVAAMFLVPYLFNRGGGGAATTYAPYALYIPPVGEPAAAEAGAWPDSTVVLGMEKGKLAIVINNITAGVDRVELKDYPATIYSKDPLAMLVAGDYLAKPFATVGLHVFIGGVEVPPPSALIRSGETPADANSRILYRTQYAWKIESQSASAVTLLMTAVAEGKPVAEIRKTFKLAEDPATHQPDANSYEITITHSIKNLTDQPIKVAIDQLAATELPRDNPQTDDRLFQVAGLDSTAKIIKGDRLNVYHAELQKLDKGTREPAEQFSDYKNNPALWVASANRFFAAITRPLPAVPSPAGAATFKLDDGRGSEIPEVTHIASGSIDVMHHDENVQLTAGAIRLTGAPVEVAAGQSVDLPLSVYLGPKDPAILKGDIAAPAGTPQSNYAVFAYSKAIQYSRGGMCGFMTIDWLVEAILWLFGVLAHSVAFGNFGVAIMLLVIVVRAALHPLTRASQVNMAVMGKKMKDLQPKLEAIKKKYADNKQKQTEETMRVYRENNVNPAGGLLGCLPMLIQMPIWIALYSGLGADIALRHASFIPGWINDLSSPDTIWPTVHRAIGHPYFTFPLLGEVYGLNLLPILMTAVFFIQMKVTTASQPKPADEQQAQMAKISQYMIFIFPLFLYGAPSGLNVYIFASTLGGLVDTYFVRKTLKKRGILPTSAAALPTHEEA